MKDSEGVAFLQWALPQLRMRWPGFRKVRKQVNKRIKRRRKALDLPDLAAYRAYLETQPEEWALLDSLCRVSISRFYRDRAVFDHLGRVILPTLAGLALERGEKELRCWSIGCASGEEVYTLNLIWRLTLQTSFPALSMRFMATEADEQMLQRARAGCYPASSLKELPPAWRERAFSQTNKSYCIRDEYRTGLEFHQQDIRVAQPGGEFHLILCRNLVLTYFEEVLQQQLLTQIIRRLSDGGALVIGKLEHLPGKMTGLGPWFSKLGIYVRQEKE